MKNKKSLFLDVITIGLFCVTIGFASMCAMDLAIAVQKPRLVDREKAVQGFLRQSFSFLIPFVFQKHGKCLTEGINKEMKDRFIDQKDRSLRMLFDFASLIPDLQCKIASQLLGETNYSAMHNFLTKPINYQIPRCIFSHMIADKKALPCFVLNAFDHNDPRSFQVSTIFESLEDVITVDRIMQVGLQEHHYNRKELAALDNVLKLFPFVGRSNQSLWLRYQYHDTYTLSNLVKKISEAQCLGFVILAMPCISAFIGQKLCTKVIVPHLAELNRRTMIKNEGILKELQATGEQLLPGDLFKMVNPLKHSWLNYAKIIVPYGAMVPSLILTLELFDRDSKSVREVIMGLLKEAKKYRRATALGLSCGLLPFLIFEALFYVASWVASSMDSALLESLLDNRLAVHGGLLGLYMLGCLVCNVKRMRARQVRVVSLENIAHVLNNKNIVIM